MVNLSKMSAQITIQNRHYLSLSTKTAIKTEYCDLEKTIHTVTSHVSKGKKIIHIP